MPRGHHSPLGHSAENTALSGSPRALQDAARGIGLSTKERECANGGALRVGLGRDLPSAGLNVGVMLVAISYYGGVHIVPLLSSDSEPKARVRAGCASRACARRLAPGYPFDKSICRSLLSRDRTARGLRQFPLRSLP